MRRLGCSFVLVLLAACGPAGVSRSPFPAVLASATPQVPTLTQSPESLVLKTPFTPLFDGVRAMQVAATQMQWVPRDTGSPGWQHTGDYIIRQLRQSGWQITEQRFPYRGITCRNILAQRGSGPLLLLGAHYDSRRQADHDPDPNKQHEPVPAANDGASGVAVLLELARVVRPEAFGRTVQLAFLDAEDDGDLDGWEWTVGSNYLATHLAVRPVAVVILDMIGDTNLDVYYESNSTPALRESVWAAAARQGFTQFIPREKYGMLDDHSPFLAQGIPAVDVIDFDYPPWHTTGDTLDKISATSLAIVGQTMELWLNSGGVL